MTVHIRPLIARDSSDAAQIFFDAINFGTADVYTEEQRLAWAGDKPNQDGWHNRFINLDGYVAEVGGQMVGFMTIDETGYIDLAFVTPETIGNGIGRKLYEAVEIRALEYKAKLLTTQASKKPSHSLSAWAGRLNASRSWQKEM